MYGSPGDLWEYTGWSDPRDSHGDRGSPTSTDEESGGEDREVQILDEIKLERRAKSRVEGWGLPRGALP